MHQVINIRGTSGSGKSTIVREIMEKGHITPIGESQKKPDGYIVQIPELATPIYIVGPYVTVCGGCDQIQTQDEICERIRVYSGFGDVLVEGLLMSHSFARYVALDRELVEKNVHCVWAFLDTPLDVCLNRVRARRDERALLTGRDRGELNTKNTTDKWNDNREVYEKFLKARSSDWKLVPKFGYRGSPMALDARLLDHTRATEQVYEWLSSRQ
jgi:hypothetical protein